MSPQAGLGAAVPTDVFSLGVGAVHDALPDQPLPAALHLRREQVVYWSSASSITSETETQSLARPLRFTPPSPASLESRLGPCLHGRAKEDPGGLKGCPSPLAVRSSALRAADASEQTR